MHQHGPGIEARAAVHVGDSAEQPASQTFAVTMPMSEPCVATIPSANAEDPRLTAKASPRMPSHRHDEAIRPPAGASGRQRCVCGNKCETEWLDAGWKCPGLATAEPLLVNLHESIETDPSPTLYVDGSTHVASSLFVPPEQASHYSQASEQDLLFREFCKTEVARLVAEDMSLLPKLSNRQQLLFWDYWADSLAR